MKKIFLLLIVIFISGDITYGQSSGAVLDKMVDFLPPPPNASAIVRYGSTGINKNTGTPNISIPLYSVKGIRLSTSVSLGYTSNGIKVDEVASRTGMGWAINAGGVITRAVRGVPDEWNTRHYPYAPIGFNWGTLMYMNRIATSSMHNGYDAEPDLFNFSFDGYSGSFVFNGNMTTPVLITKNGLKITANFTGAAWNFKIITPEGLIYLFGGSSAVEKSKRDQTCGRNFNEYIPTSWYLKEIQHLTGEKIYYNYTTHNYKYDNGVSQIMYGTLPGASCTPQTISSCINVNNVQGVLLTSIQSVSNKINFEYTSRQDCTDKLISKIIYSVSNTALTSTDFVYTNIETTQDYQGESYWGYKNTPYLTSIIENSQDNSLHNTHYFSYINPQGRPARLSYAQDHWGMFNGQYNLTLIPRLNDAAAVSYPNATANRNPEARYAQEGMLEKIVYPTGGITTFFYDPNISNSGASTSFKTKHTLNCDVTGYTNSQATYGVNTKTKYFQTNTTDYAPKLTVECRANGPYNYTHNTGRVTIYSPQNQTIIDILCSPDDPIITYNLPYFEPGTYQIILKAQGASVTTLATLAYKGTSTLSTQSTQQAGGLRVSKIITSSGSGGTPSIKKYYYGTYNNLYSSSLSYLIGEPTYLSNYKCQANGSTLNIPEISSSSILNLGFFNNNFISYNSVVEGFGEDFENGGTETKFYTNSDALGSIVWNNDIKNAPYSNFSSAYNGRILSETILKKSSSGLLIPVKKSDYSYENDFNNESIVEGYTTARDFNFAVTGIDTTCNPAVNPTCSGYLSQNLFAFNMVRYSIFSSWVHLKTQTETIYDQDGNNPLVTVADLRYDNPNNFELTSSQTDNSKGETIKTTYKYPHDYTGTPVYDAMVANNLVSPIINTKTEIVNPTGNTVLSEQKTEFSIFGFTNYEPGTLKAAVNGGPLIIQGTIDLYDQNGNILQFTDKSGIVSSIIWGYNYKYPVAKITGSIYNNAIGQLGTSVALLQTMDGAILQNYLNNVRIGLTNAQVTSYTYKVNGGVSSLTDVNNKSNTYEYDSFHRLLHIKDQDGNVVKTNSYNIITPSNLSGLPIFYNDPIVQSVQCNTCLPGFTGNFINYTVPYGKYYSSISLNDANDKAAIDMAENKQENANKNGTCSNTATCVGNGYKFVSCACELGTKICESSIYYPSSGLWINTYHYIWSDFSVSYSFGEVMPPCIGINKKKMNCVCETGYRVCENTLDLGGGNYRVTYHYRFSDNTNSASITEDINCTGVDKKLINCECQTAAKIYITSVICPSTPAEPGCPIGTWKCTFNYRWSDGSTSGPFTEYSNSSCIAILPTED